MVGRTELALVERKPSVLVLERISNRDQARETC
jgi:hypothetical protein